MRVELRVPALADLHAYRAALEAGYSPSTAMGDARRRADLARIDSDPAGFVAGLDDPEAKGGDVEQPDGSFRPRIPGITRWIFADEGFAGTIGLRWQRGTEALPPHVLGHIGYSVVPWQRRRGVATHAVALMLAEAAAQNLRFIEISTDPDNLASQRVILNNGGVLVERFRKPDSHGGAEGLRFRIDV